MSPRPALVLTSEDPEIEVAETAHGDKPPMVREVVGTAVGFTIGLADDRQVTFQTGFAEDEPDHLINARFDRIMALADRQKAKYELVKLREELETHDKALARLVEDIARVDVDFEKSQAQLDVQIVEYQRRKGELEQSIYQNNVSTGRSGNRKPQGHASVSLKNIEAGIDNAKADKEKNIAERDQHRETVLAQRGRFEEEIARIKSKIAAKEALLEG
jgi:predicted  nucleic acid-binding Zn-ribbon protein